MMRRRLVLLGVALLLVVGFAVPLVAQAASVWHWSGESAWAVFTQTDGDLETRVYIDAGEGKYTSPPKNGDVFSYVYVWEETYNTVTWDYVDGAWGYAALAPKEFVVANTLRSASLSATVPMTTWGGDEYDLGVDVDWTALGRPIRDRTVSHYVYPGVENSNWSYSANWATASANGAFTYMGEPVYDDASDWASIQSSKNRRTSVYHYVYP